MDVFIASSKESEQITRAVKIGLQNLNVELDLKCWFEVFESGHFVLEDLMTHLPSCQFAIFILTPDDKLECRGQSYFCARDNVILELGASLGYLGRKKTFIIAVSTKERNIKIPTDLGGLTIIPWNCEKDFDSVEEHDLMAVLGKLKKGLKDRVTCLDLLHYDVFTKFDKFFDQFFKNAKNIITSFIHSRRWRENNDSQIKSFFNKEDTKWTFLLPDIEDDNLIKNLKAHFDDGLTMTSKIIDCYDFCSNLMRAYPNKVDLYLYSFYPTYSFYKFDDKMVVSFYPLTDERKNTPTLCVDLKSEINEFYVSDCESQIKKSRKINLQTLLELIDKSNVA